MTINCQDRELEIKAKANEPTIIIYSNGTHERANFQCISLNKKQLVWVGCCSFPVKGRTAKMQFKCQEIHCLISCLDLETGIKRNCEGVSKIENM